MGFLCLGQLGVLHRRCAGTNIAGMKAISILVQKTYLQLPDFFDAPNSEPFHNARTVSPLTGQHLCAWYILEDCTAGQETMPQAMGYGYA